MMKLLAYVTGPYDSASMRQVVLMANELWHDNIASYVPHLFWHQNLIAPRPTEDWIEQSRVVLSKCNILFRLKGESAQCDDEVAFALEQGIPVFTCYKELLTFIREGSSG